MHRFLKYKQFETDDLMPSNEVIRCSVTLPHCLKEQNEYSKSGACFGNPIIIYSNFYFIRIHKFVNFTCIFFPDMVFETKCFHLSMTRRSADNEDNDLFLVDSGVESLAKVYLNLPNLQTLNLHSNYVCK